MLEEITSFIGQEIWIAKLSAVFVAALILRFASSLILDHANKVANATKNIWDDAIIKSVREPLLILIWLIAAKFSVEILVKNFHSEEVTLIVPIVSTFIIICFAWFLMRVINFSVTGFIAAERFTNDEFGKTSIDAISKVLKLIVVVIALLIILQIYGVSISAILAAGGAGGLVIGFAAKDLVANIFGGVTIYLDRPFNVGDWIRCSEKNIEGTVENIGWRQTRVRAFNKNPIYVPNAIFTNAVVENPSRMTHRRIKEHIGIRYEDIAKMAVITKEVREMLLEHDEIDNDQTIIVNFNIFNASSIDFLVYAFIKVIDWRQSHIVKQDVFLKIAKIIENHGAEIAFPTRTLHIENSEVL